MRNGPYPDYRDSGVAWLGEVPRHWGVSRLKFSATYRSSSVDKKSGDDELVVRLCNYTDVYYRERIRARDEFMEATATPEEIRRFRLNIGDVVITKDSEDWRDIAVPALVEEAADDLICGYHLGVIRPDEDELFGSFLLRALQSPAVNHQFRLAASGVTRYGLPNSAAGDALLPLPPLDEQRAIAAFLDPETSRIDTLVAKKRLLIERLEEQRTALISRTVTRGLPPEAARAAGLDPSPRLKPSGVEWLGDVPEHWGIGRIRDLAELMNGFPFDSELFHPDDGVPLIRIRDLFSNRTEVNWSGDPVPSAEVNDGDVLIGMDGDFNVAWWDRGRAVLNQRLCCLRARRTVLNQRFLYYCLPFPLRALNEVTYATTVRHLSSFDVMKFRVPLPSLDEQAVIVAFLECELGRISAVVQATEVAIERLTEYRTALITAAVTGKIDVRESARAVAGVK